MGQPGEANDKQCAPDSGRAKGRLLTPICRQQGFCVPQGISRAEAWARVGRDAKKKGPVQGDHLGWGLGGNPKLELDRARGAYADDDTDHWGLPKELLWRGCELSPRTGLKKRAHGAIMDAWLKGGAC